MAHDVTNPSGASVEQIVIGAGLSMLSTGLPGQGIVTLAVSGGGLGTSLTPVTKTGAYTAAANDWVLADTTGGTFAVNTGCVVDAGMIATSPIC